MASEERIAQVARMVQAEQHAQRGRPMQIARALDKAGLIAPAPMSDQPWTEGHPDGPRVDVDGVAWYACDPYPTWYRWEGGRLIRPAHSSPNFSKDRSR